MWAVTGWAAATWLRITIALGVAVALCWWQLGDGSGWFWAVCAAAATLETYATRQLGREWAHEAHASWWWTP